MYCHVLSCVAVCCSVLQCAAVCCSVLQCRNLRVVIFLVTEAIYRRNKRVVKVAEGLGVTNFLNIKLVTKACMLALRFWLIMYEWCVDSA